MQQDAPVGVPSGDSARDGGVPSRVVVSNFHGPTFRVPPPPATLRRESVPVNAYFNGDEAFCVHIGEPGLGFHASLWTTEDGLVAVIRACQATLDRARLAKRQAALDASAS